ncbi:hypothetical protein DFS34DRAFT_707230 [Phlyctochytrium arcticum]|nr:hypothetical protein DFS34DRAFT_707230 [Phlyctochytrium arcticum]
MGKSPSDYILRVRVGNSYDTSTHQTASVNDEANPVLVDGEHFKGYIAVRIANFSGVVPEGNEQQKPKANPSSHYFHGRSRRYSVMIQGRFKEEWNGDDIIYGIEFDGKIRTPTGVSLAVKIAKWLDPALDVCLSGPQPYIFSPMISAMNSMAIFPPDAPEDDTNTDIGVWSFASRLIPEQPAALFPISSQAPALTAFEKRKSHFGDAKARKEIRIRSDQVFCMDFYDAYFDFNSISLKLPGFSLNVFKYWDGQPMRFVCRTRDRSATFFVVQFEFLDREKLGLLPAGASDANIPFSGLDGLDDAVSSP